MHIHFIIQQFYQVFLLCLSILSLNIMYNVVKNYLKKTNLFFFWFFNQETKKDSAFVFYRLNDGDRLFYVKTIGFSATFRQF